MSGEPSRGLLRQSEKEYLKEESSNKKYQSVSVIRNRMDQHLVDDIETIRNNHTDLYAEFLSMVDETCPEIEAEEL